MTKSYKIFLSLAILSLCFSIGLHFLASDDWDKLWLLTAAHKWLDGKKLYVDIFEVNPPLIIWIDAIPAYLSMHVPFLSDTHYSVLMGIVAVLCVIMVSLALIRQHPEFTGCRKQGEFCLLLASVFITFQNPLYFFDREHIFLILTFPYLLRFMPTLAKTPVSKRLSIITGVMAGIGFCIKPHCFIVFAGMQLIYFLRERSLMILASVENIIIYLLASAYLAAIFVLAPDYITTVFPMALATYSVINKKMQGIVYPAIAAFYLLITFTYFRLRTPSPYRRDIFYLLANCVFFALYGFTNNGWGYTWVPLYGVVFMTTGWVLMEQLTLKKEYEKKGLPSQPFVSGIGACMFVLALNAIAVAPNLILETTTCENIFECGNGKQFIKEAEAMNGGQPVTSFGTISMDCPIWTFFSRQTGAEWVTRFNHLWMLPKFFISDAAFAAKNKWITDYVSNAYAQDLHNSKPQLVFVDDADQFYTVKKSEDLVAFLEASPTFADEWKNYRYAGKIEGVEETKNKTTHHGYYVYKRMN